MEILNYLKKNGAKWIPLLLVLITIVLGYSSGIYRALDVETLRYHHVELTEYVNNNPILTPFMFIISYAMIITFFIPGWLCFALLGGFLFPQPFSTLYLAIGATLGALLFFLVIRAPLQAIFSTTKTFRFRKIREMFNKSPTTCMLFLRIVPFFPFWFVCLIGGYFNAPLSTYIWTTLIGVFPYAFLFTRSGRGLNMAFESLEKFPSLGSILTPEIKMILTCAGVFVALCILIIKWTKRDRPTQSSD